MTCQSYQALPAVHQNDLHRQHRTQEIQNRPEFPGRKKVYLNNNLLSHFTARTKINSNYYQVRIIGVDFWQPGYMPPIIEKRPCIYYFTTICAPNIFVLPTQYF